ncbi:glycerophosphodiester phosphodiesterase [Brachybacterium sp. AOP3-A1-3]|uniref:glycerophosphodiester phosphodiesterase n=1 Tax=Brachybacterium sp. AOP3-A1-3 TaxID=3457699 RepID=UPI0040341337
MSRRTSVPRITGHRGAAAVAPENTLAAFRRGAADGADQLECDVHLSRDRRDVIIHDATIDRTAQGDSPRRSGTVADLTRAELDEVLVGEGERIPTLIEVLDAAVREDGTRLPVLVEIKAPAAAALAGQILQDTFPGSVWSGEGPAPARIISFHTEALRIALEVAPDVPRGLLVRALSEQALDDAMATKAEILGVRLSDVRDGDFDRIRGVGLIPSAWAARTDDEIRRAVDLGVPEIGADDPAHARRVVEQHLASRD